MNATITQVNRYMITINGETFENFKRVEEWEGMVKFSGPNGIIVVDNLENEFASNYFCDIFGRRASSTSVEMRIVKLSQNLIPKEDKIESDDAESGD